MHLIGILWFLWIFGNNVEDSMGHGRFVVFYLLTGLAASGAHVALNPGSPVPMVGASGAISGVMGAYLVLYPKARVDTLFFFFVFIRVIPLPAWVMLGYWMLLQLGGPPRARGLLRGGRILAFIEAIHGPEFGVASATGGGVAYAAHVGGFLAGVALIPLFRRKRLVDAKRRGHVVDAGDLDGGGWW